MTKKNKVLVYIDDCFKCPNAIPKFDKKDMKNYQYCRTSRSCIRLGDCYGARPIPNWCPRLNHKLLNLCNLMKVL